MTFRITLRTGNKDLHYTVERVNVTPRSEQFIIHGRNKTITLESNRPLFRNKGLKHRKPDFQIIEGEAMARSWIDPLAKAIMAVMEPAPVKTKSVSTETKAAPVKRTPSTVMLKDRKKY